nr:hypothetical protein CFP56_15228 [Quercus suber]
MEKEVVENLQKLQLTKEEEEDISISQCHKLELIEECTLNLFGRLLSDRHQNIRALKSTLRAAWKMGSGVLIVEDLLFEHMNEEVGKELGRKLGNVIDVDKRSMQADQAKFLRIRVYLPIDKPFRKGGYISAENEERSWVSFRYERLPVFYFMCGKLRHDERHCDSSPAKRMGDRQYREWMRAGGSAKTGGERGGFTEFRKLESKGNDGMTINL